MRWHRRGVVRGTPLRKSTAKLMVVLALMGLSYKCLAYPIADEPRIEVEVAGGNPLLPDPHIGNPAPCLPADLYYERLLARCGANFDEFTTTRRADDRQDVMGNSLIRVWRSEVEGGRQALLQYRDVPLAANRRIVGKLSADGRSLYLARVVSPSQFDAHVDDQLEIWSVRLQGNVPPQVLDRSFEERNTVVATGRPIPDEMTVTSDGDMLGWITTTPSTRLSYGSDQQATLMLFSGSSGTLRRIELQRPLDRDSVRPLVTQWCCRRKAPIFIERDQAALALVSGHLWLTSLSTLQAFEITPDDVIVKDFAVSESGRIAIVTLDPRSGLNKLMTKRLATSEWSIEATTYGTVSKVTYGAGEDSPTTVIEGISCARTTTRADESIQAQWTRHIKSCSDEISAKVFAFQARPGVVSTGVLYSRTGDKRQARPAIFFSHPGTPGLFADQGGRYLAGDDDKRIDIPKFLAAGYVVVIADVPMPPKGMYAGGPAKSIVKGLEVALSAARRAAPFHITAWGVTGISYGGYMASIGATQTNLFAAAVSISGPVDIPNMLATTDVGQRWWAGYEDEVGQTLAEHSDRLVSNSPLFSVSSESAPLLMLQGARDGHPSSRGPKAMLLAYQLAGVDASWVDYHTAEHEIAYFEPYASDVTSRTIAWFDKFLKR